ncbi:FAD-dependent oxidoreductase [Paenibacillus sp. CAU 1523]|uniref:FAD-dependent oxidoreductase n=2 Tax=Paenibacillus arenosi TaxID=2774142 RepID=A0ABR9B2Y8_9BACL|nr:FAD-dependent oxidoreductase [Paenibacillus arenosi]
MWGNFSERGRGKGENKFYVKTIALLLVVAILLPHQYVMASGASCGNGCSTYDIVLIGSEVEGMMLAKAAHKNGLKVLVLDPREKPGGQLIQGQMQVLDEPNDKRKRSLVQGEMKKLYDGYKSKNIRTHEQFTRYYNQLIKGIPLRSGITIKKVSMGKRDKLKTVDSITYIAKDKKTYTVKADYWVENTDHNALTGKLGVKRIPGVETVYKSKKPDYMAATLMLKFKNVNWPKLHQAVLKDYPLTNVAKKYGPGTYVDWNYATGFSNVTAKFKPNDSQLMLRGLNTTYQLNGKVIMNAFLIFDVDPANPESVRKAREKAIKEAPRVLQFLKKNIPGYEHAQLDGFPDYLYIRDYNRFETDYIINYEDVMSGKMFWDNVSIGSYPVDLQGTKSVPKGITLGKPDRYGIPLRSFMLKEYENVIVAGKNVGATATAYGSVRIMPNTALAAETIGIIIAREGKHKRLKQLTPSDFKRIHKYLEYSYRIKVQK